MILVIKVKNIKKSLFFHEKYFLTINSLKKKKEVKIFFFFKYSSQKKKLRFIQFQH